MDSPSTLPYAGAPEGEGARTGSAPALDSGSSTLGAAGGPAMGSVAPTLLAASRHQTVLPELRSEGGRVELVPREQARYENQRLLGRGGMGEVKLAEDHDIGRLVAIKRLLGEADPRSIARFVDEVRTVGRLEHPNIVPIHDVGVDPDGSLFFVMKYVDGETLSSVIERLAAGDEDTHRRYTFEHRLDLFSALCRALQYAHSHGLVHRDVKPENIMVGRYGEVILMDWGIAHRIRAEVSPSLDRADISQLPQRAGGETVDGTVIGTPQYMSPEQAAGEVAELDGRSDLYSAFVSLWELLTLVPYIAGGKTAIQTVLAAQERVTPGPYGAVFKHPRQAEAVPVELRHFLRRGLAKPKEERFLNAEEVLVTLDALRAGDFAVQCPVTLLKQGNTKMERFMDRRPKRSAILAGFTAFMILAGLGGWVALALALS